MKTIKNWESGHNYGDFCQWEISLVKRRFFWLVCEGGSQTVFAEKLSDGSYARGKYETKISSEEAKELEQMDTDEVYSWVKDKIIRESWQ